MAAVLQVISLCAFARPLEDWPYARLVQEADFVAVVKVVSVTNSTGVLSGHGDSSCYQARTACMRILKVMKGDICKVIQLEFFTYSATGCDDPDGAHFISLDASNIHEYTVFLKHDSGKLIPVSGHYDAAESVRPMQKGLILAD